LGIYDASRFGYWPNLEASHLPHTSNLLIVGVPANCAQGSAGRRLISGHASLTKNRVTVRGAGHPPGISFLLVGADLSVRRGEDGSPGIADQVFRRYDRLAQQFVRMQQFRMLCREARLMAGGGYRSSREALVAAYTRERHVVQAGLSAALHGQRSGADREWHLG
jgi:hypothetical protein